MNLCSTVRRGLILMFAMSFFAVAYAEEPVSTDADTRREIAALKKEKRMMIVQAIVDSKKSCVAEHFGEDDDVVRTCFRKKVKTEIKNILFVYRDAKKECAKLGFGAAEKELCALQILIEAAPAGDATSDRSFGSGFETEECPFETDDKNIVCGYVTVPEKHDSPTPKTLRLAVAVLKSTDGAEPDPIFYLDGGPGGSSLQNVELWVDSPFRKSRDIILFDQRGTGFSEPALECPEFNEVYLDAVASGKIEDNIQKEAAAMTACFERIENEGSDLSAYNSAEGVRDIDDIRTALGYDDINLLGISYGTRLAQTAMRDTPQHIRSVVMDSVLPVEEDLLGDNWEYILDVFNTIFTKCREDTECVAAYPNFEQDFTAVLEELTKRPVTVRLTDEQTGKINKVTVGPGQFFLAVYRLTASSEGISYLPVTVDFAKRGEFEFIAGMLIENESGLADQINMAVNYTVLCNEEYRHVEKVEKPKSGRSILDFVEEEIQQSAYQLICENWKYGHPNPYENEAVKSDIPTLILSGEFDTITPRQWGEKVAKNLSESVHLVFPVSHGETSTTEGCGAGIAGHFFDKPSAAPDLKCMEDLDEFEFFTGATGGAGENVVCHRRLTMYGDFEYRVRYPISDQSIAERVGCYYADFDKNDRLEAIQFVRFGGLYDDYENGFSTVSFRYLKKGQEIHSFFYDTGDQATDDGAHSISYEQKGESMLVREYNLNGDVIEDANGRRSYEYELDADGRKKARYRLDESGKRTVNDFGVYVKKYRVNDEGLVTEVTFHDKKGMPIASDEDGIALITFEYDAFGNEIAQTYFDTEGKKTEDTDGTAEIRSEYDQFGNETKRTYFGSDGSPAPDKDDMTSIEWKYNADGQETEMKYLSAKGKPVEDSSKGFAVLRSEYNDYGQMVEQSVYDKTGELVDDLRDGVARIVWKYDSDYAFMGVWFYDRNGNLVDNKLYGYAVKKWEDDSRIKMIYLDKEGNEVEPK